MGQPAARVVTDEDGRLMLLVEQNGDGHQKLITSLRTSLGEVQRRLASRMLKFVIVKIYFYIIILS